MIPGPYSPFFGKDWRYRDRGKGEEQPTGAEFSRVSYSDMKVDERAVWRIGARDDTRLSSAGCGMPDVGDGDAGDTRDALRTSLAEHAVRRTFNGDACGLG